MTKGEMIVAIHFTFLSPLGVDWKYFSSIIWAFHRAILRLSLKVKFWFKMLLSFNDGTLVGYTAASSASDFEGV